LCELLAEFGGAEAEEDAAANEGVQLGGVLPALFSKLPGAVRSGHWWCDVCAVAVAHFDEVLAGELFVDSKDGVDVDGELLGELADGGKAGPGWEGPGEALSADLLGDLP
jgi:hypothetical protein